MAELLSDHQITQALHDLPGWESRSGSLFRAVTAPDFMSGIRLVDRVAEAAERMNHHPDVDIRWTTVSFSLATHSLGGVTTNDVELAKLISDEATGLGAS